MCLHVGYKIMYCLFFKDALVSLNLKNQFLLKSNQNNQISNKPLKLQKSNLVVEICGANPFKYLAWPLLASIHYFLSVSLSVCLSVCLSGYIFDLMSLHPGHIVCQTFDVSSCLPFRPSVCLYFFKPGF